jgi:hypothetical protein
LSAVEDVEPKKQFMTLETEQTQAQSISPDDLSEIPE